MSNQKKYNTFRLTFPELVYEGYHYNVQSTGLHISFDFRLNDALVFHPEATIATRSFVTLPSLPAEYIERLVFNIGMIELISYWKAFCPPTVRVMPHSLNDEQVAFWKKLYYNGLGEFFYLNGIRATEVDFMTIVSSGAESGAVAMPTLHGADGEAYIVPIGGGKDSVVTLELLRDAAVSRRSKPLPLVMNPRGATLGCCKVAGYGREDIIEIDRKIDPLLLDLNGKGALNGHTPFSAMLAFYTLLAAALTGRRNIALSNENSANEATDLASGVNHQYSKSLEFENDFRAYVGRYISADFNYFSFLRPLSELQIAMLFSQQTQYHDVFRSCNVGSKQDVWCGHCPKCLFAFIILSPFVAPERLTQIFGHNLLDDKTLATYFRQLTGREAVKPFECVGTVAEVNTALAMTIDRWYGGERPCLLRDFAVAENRVSLTQLAEQHNLSQEELTILQRYVL